MWRGASSEKIIRNENVNTNAFVDKMPINIFIAWFLCVFLFSVEMQRTSTGSMCFELPRALKNSRQSRMWFTDFCNFVWHRRGQNNLSGHSRSSLMLFFVYFQQNFGVAFLFSCHTHVGVCVGFTTRLNKFISFDKYFHAISKHQPIESEWSKIIKIKNNKSLIIVVLNVSFISVSLAFCR